MMRDSLVARAGVICLIGLTAACAGSGSDAEGTDGVAGDAAAVSAADAALEAELQNLREITSRYEDVNAAVAAGYVPDPSGMCITAEMEGMPAEHGAMGIHYLRPDLLGLLQAPGRVNGTGMHTDFTEPSVLLYEPQADGAMRLVGIENLVWAESWRAAGNATPPSYQGHEFNYMIDDPATEFDEAHGFEPHYDLHVWIHRDNPNGVFESFNPAVTCAHMAHAPASGDQ